MKVFTRLIVAGVGLVLLSCGGISGGGGTNNAAPGLATPLTTSEIAGLKYMREEEELARDLYMDIFNNKGLTIFKTISENAETQHAAKMLTLLTTYGESDPSTGLPNTYTDAGLQSLYNQLLATATGATSTNLSALRVGALVEEVDIQDINDKKALVQAEHALITSTYDNLLCGSRNHLRSFVAQIELLTGTTYAVQTPVLAAEVATILAGSQEQCGQ